MFAKSTFGVSQKDVLGSKL